MWGFRRVVGASVGLITLALVAPWGAPKAVADGDRLGCSSYCQTAGGYGGAGGNRPPPAATLDSTSVTADADGYVPVTLRCHLPQGQCMGVLMLGAIGGGAGGRSDLLVNAGATRTIAIPSGADGIAFLRSHGPTPFYLTIDAGQTPGCQDRHDAGCGYANNDFSYVSDSLVLTVAPPG